MQLPDYLQPRFDQFIHSKMNQVMAETSTFSLNKSYEYFALIFTEVLNGENYKVQMDKARLKYEQDLKKARQEAKKARQEAEKTRQEAEKTRQEAAEKTRQEAEVRSKQRTNTILKLYHLKSWTVEQISEMMELDIEFVKNLIQNNQLP
jgi:vacuolar-type H+-ATPase subunit H